MVTEESTYTTYDPLGFTARERDDETRLYYYRARYYDPQLGRFISEDPIGLAGGPNVYAYVGNNPISNTDPTGLWCVAGPVYSATCGSCEPGWRRVDGVCQSDRGRGYGEIARTGTGDDIGGAAPGGWGEGYGGGIGVDVVGKRGAPPQNPIANAICRVARAVRLPGGGYWGVSGSLFSGLGITGGFGVYWDDQGPGLYLRGGGGIGVQASAGWERGVVVGSIAGHAVEGEIVTGTYTTGLAVGVPLTGGTGTRLRHSEGRAASPLGGHIAGTHTVAAPMCR